jgi:hypothetical protein
VNVKVAFNGVTPQSAPLPQTVPWGWFHIPHPNPAVPEIHLMPASDCGNHAFDLGCACAPAEMATPGFFQHNAFDGREAYESGARKHH